MGRSKLDELQWPLVLQTEDDDQIDIGNFFNDVDGSQYNPETRERTGNVLTAGGHIVTAVIGSGVLSLPWCMAQLGWVVGFSMVAIFSCITYFTSCLLADCYRVQDPVIGDRNTTYSKAVKKNLGRRQVWFCGIVQYVSLYGTSVGYVITAALSMVSIAEEICTDTNGSASLCTYSSSVFVIMFGVAELVLSQIPNFGHAWWLSIISAVMSFSYASIGLLLSVLKVVDNGGIKGSTWGKGITHLDNLSSLMGVFRALGDIAFAYSFAVILIEIQDTLKSPPAENVTMKKASLLGSSVTTLFYVLSAGTGYAAFGANAPGNLLASFGESKFSWLVSIANVCVVVHLLGAYQVFCQPIYASIEKRLSRRYPQNQFLNQNYMVQICCFGQFKINLFRITWRTSFVVSTVILAIIFPYFNDVLGILGSINFWPLTVYFPVEIYIAHTKMQKWTAKWVSLQFLSCACFVVSAVAMVGSVGGLVQSLISGSI